MQIRHDYRLVSRMVISPVPIADDDEVSVGLRVADDDVAVGDNERCCLSRRIDV
jgi:hypothetical protein